MYRILVTGANGQLGSEIRELSKMRIQNGNVFFFTDYKELDITNSEAIRDFVLNNKINIIINCAAYTAVDKAETEPELAEMVNAMAPKYLATIAKDFGCKLVHISTDYVFDGENYKPYVETDEPNPQSVYGQSKLNGEKYIQEINPQNCIIIRTSWVYSKFGNNFVKTMLKLGSDRECINVINDQVGSPTYARDLADVILKILPMIMNENVEVVHYSNEGVCSWYDFAYEIFTLTNKKVKLKSISSKDYQTIAKRPFYTQLDKHKIKHEYNVEIDHWKIGLIQCLAKIKN